MPDDVSDHQRGTAVRQRKAVHPVAADTRAVGGGGLVDAGRLDGVAAGPRQQSALQGQYLCVLALVLTGQVHVVGGPGHQFLQVEELAVREGEVRPPPDLRDTQDDGRRPVQDQRYAHHGRRLVAGHQGTYQPRTVEHPFDRFSVGYDDGLRGIVTPYGLRQQSTRIAGKIVARGHVAVGPRPVRHQGRPPQPEAPLRLLGDRLTCPHGEVEVDGGHVTPGQQGLRQRLRGLADVQRGADRGLGGVQVQPPGHGDQ